MDSSSDGSFAWTDASKDSSDSGFKINGTMNKVDTENESESGKSYKKKLKNELFTVMNEDVKHEQLSKQKDRKRKLSERQSDDGHAGKSKKKKIKKEPESDIDGFVAANSHLHNNNGHDDSYDESYLNSKVKAEEHFAIPSPNKFKKKKNKTISGSDNFNEDSFYDINKKSKKQSNDFSSEETELEDNHLNMLVEEENEYHEKKSKKKNEGSFDDMNKKSKKQSNDFSSEEAELEDKHLNMLVDAENEYHEKKSKKKKKKKISKSKDSAMSDAENKDFSVQECTPEEEHFTPPVSVEDRQTTDSASSSILPFKGKEKKSKKSLSHPNDGDFVTEQTDIVNHALEQTVNKNVSFNIQSETSKRKPRISDRIQFEDDESSDANTSQSHIKRPSAKSNKIEHFLSNNINLKPFTSQLETQSVLTRDDEMWLIRCPRDIDVNAFENKDFALEGKCKLKLNGQTYEGIVDDMSGNMSILTSEYNNYVIKSLSVRGCVSLRKRIPKSHVHGETMVNNQTNFIPLPETKCRHPLLGSNYKKAIKLPAAVAQRLRAPGGHAPTKEKIIDNTTSKPKVEPSPESLVKLEQDPDRHVNNKKKRKKKNRNNEDTALGKVQHKKHDIESVDAWESEQAIEKNLFNF